MAYSSLSLVLASLILLLSPPIHAQSPSAPAPSPSGPINITAILEKAGQYTIFIRLLTSKESGEVANQINNQVKNSNEGMTVFAPTDNAFTNLPGGFLNNLTPQRQAQLILYHVLPKYYSMKDLQTVSNPVRTQSTGQDGGAFGLYFSSSGNQVNISSGVVETQVNNALRQDSPLAVYQLDKVLIPKEFSEAKAPASAPPTVESTPSDAKPTKSAEAKPGPASGSGRVGVGFACVAGLGLVSMALL